jgi:hypothetical protein
MNCQACCQDNAVLNFNRAMGKSSYEQLIPPCKSMHNFQLNETMEATPFKILCQCSEQHTEIPIKCSSWIQWITKLKF